MYSVFWKVDSAFNSIMLTVNYAKLTILLLYLHLIFGNWMLLELKLLLSWFTDISHSGKSQYIYHSFPIVLSPVVLCFFCLYFLLVNSMLLHPYWGLVFSWEFYRWKFWFKILVRQNSSLHAQLRVQCLTPTPLPTSSFRLLNSSLFCWILEVKLLKRN